MRKSKKSIGYYEMLETENIRLQDELSSVSKENVRLKKYYSENLNQYYVVTNMGTQHYAHDEKMAYGTIQYVLAKKADHSELTICVEKYKAGKWVWSVNITCLKDAPDYNLAMSYKTYKNTVFKMRNYHLPEDGTQAYIRFAEAIRKYLLGY
jgi:hypothetical protein